MTKNLFDPKDFDGKDEEIVGVHTGLHASGIELQEGRNTSTNRNYCANCKRNIHCFVKIDRETREAIIHKTCRNDDCECKCKTHYACRICDRLHPYGTKCNKPENQIQLDPKNEELIAHINEEFRKLHEETKVKTK